LHHEDHEALPTVRASETCVGIANCRNSFRNTGRIKL